MANSYFSNSFYPHLFLFISHPQRDKMGKIKVMQHKMKKIFYNLAVAWAGKIIDEIECHFK